MRVASAVLLLASVASMACSSRPQRREPTYVDQMVFSPDHPDLSAPSRPTHRRADRAGQRRGDVEADALESPVGQGHGRRRRQPATTASLGRGGGSARCAAARGGATRSIGAATQGRLLHGCLLPRRGRGYVRRNAAGYGTTALVALLQWATSEVARRYPGTVPVVIGALSKAGGGRLRGHRSHQSGRDVDIGLYASNNRALPHFRAMGHGNLDVAKSWTLISALLSRGRVQYIFMDYELQVLFVHYLREEGVPEGTLRRLFQYPAGRGARRGLIRHARGHRDHIHVRLRCPLGAPRCR